MQSSTSTGYSSNSTGSFITNCRFSRIIGQMGGRVGDGTRNGSRFYVREERTGRELHMNRLKFRTSGNLPTILEESMKYT